MNWPALTGLMSASAEPGAAATDPLACQDDMELSAAACGIASVGLCFLELRRQQQQQQQLRLWRLRHLHQRGSSANSVPPPHCKCCLPNAIPIKEFWFWGLGRLESYFSQG